MATGSETVLSMDELVSASADRQAGISWPLAIDAKLEQMLELARDAGERTSRREIAACVMAFAEIEDGEALGKMLRAYRRMRVREVIRPADDSNVVPFTTHPPGPRRRNA